MNESLKPCPFCQGEAETGSIYGVYWTFCKVCGCGTSGFHTSDDAIAAWNRRAPSKEGIDGKQ